MRKLISKSATARRVMRSDVPAVVVTETVPAAKPAKLAKVSAKLGKMAGLQRADGLGTMPAAKPAAKPAAGKLAKPAKAKAAKPAAKAAKPAAKAKAEKPAKVKAAKPLSARAQAEADCAAGILPAAPDFSAATHTRFRKKLAEIVALVKARDIKGLKAMTINPISTSPKAMDRYRNRAVTALEAQAKAAKAKAAGK